MVPTQDHDIIRIWAAKNDATPVEIPPIIFDSEPAILTFLIRNGKGTADVHPISWETFFAKFDLLGLSFAFDDCSSHFQLVRVGKKQTVEIVQ